MEKKIVLGPILAYLDQIRAAKTFFLSNIWLCQSLDIIVSYHHVQYLKKIMIQSWENLVMDRWTDGRTERRTDGETGESDLTECCPTDVEHLKSYIRQKKFKVVLIFFFFFLMQNFHRFICYWTRVSKHVSNFCQ